MTCRAERLFRSLVECGSDTVLGLDARGPIEFAGDPVEGPPGHKPEDPAGKERQFFAILLPISGIAIHLRDFTGLPVPDRPRAVQAVQNVVQNDARLSMNSRPSRMIIGSRNENGETVFSVRGRGLGIEPRYHQRIFELFESGSKFGKYRHRIGAVEKSCRVSRRKNAKGVQT